MTSDMVLSVVVELSLSLSLEESSSLTSLSFSLAILTLGALCLTLLAWLDLDTDVAFCVGWVLSSVEGIDSSACCPSSVVGAGDSPSVVSVACSVTSGLASLGGGLVEGFSGSWGGVPGGVNLVTLWGGGVSTFSYTYSQMVLVMDIAFI